MVKICMRLASKNIIYKSSFRRHLSIAILLFPCLLIGQLTKFQVLDRLNAQPVSYASIYILGADGVTADKSGTFTINNALPWSEIKVTAIGYKDATLHRNDRPGDTIYMVREVVALAPVTIPKRPPVSKSVKLGILSKSNFELSVIPPYNNRSVGKKFKGDDKVTGMPVSEIKFRTFNDLDSAVVNLKIFTLDSLHNIAGPLWNGNILVKTPAGNHKTVSVDMRQYELTYPETGIFVVLENLLFESNKLELHEGIKSSVIYEPRIKAKKTSTADDTFYFNGSEWLLNNKYSLIMQVQLGK